MNEARRLAHQERIDATKNAEERNRDGQYATPYPLAVEIMQLARRYFPEGLPVDFLEPCVGTGAFYSALRAVFPAVGRAVGIERDSAFAAAAEDLWAESGLEVIRGDFTKQKPPARPFTLLVTNPPYVRHHHLDTGEKARLRAAAARSTELRLSGLAGLYCYFLFLADRWVAERGISVWLIPSEFLDVNYGTQVKHYLTSKVNLLHLHRFCPSDVQFADALVSSTVVVFQKAEPAEGLVTFSQGGKPTAPESTKLLERAELQPERKWSQLFNGTAAGRNGVAGQRFGDLFTIKRGLATGANEFFILTPERARELGIPKQFLRPILPPPRLLPENIVRARPDGSPDLPNPKLLLDCPLEPAAVQRQFPKLWAYLQTGMEQGAHESYLASRRAPWYSQEDRPPPPFLCTYMGRQKENGGPFRFIWNQSQATAHNVYLLLYPKGPLKAALERKPALAARVFQALKALHTGTVADGARVYGGGLHKVEPKELANIPAGSIVEALGKAVSFEVTLFD